MSQKAKEIKFVKLYKVNIHKIFKCSTKKLNFFPHDDAVGYYIDKTQQPNTTCKSAKEKKNVIWQIMNYYTA